jgi:hypothetical protein
VSSALSKLTEQDARAPNVVGIPLLVLAELLSCELFRQLIDLRLIG